MEHSLVPFALASVRMLNEIYRTSVGWYIVHTFTIHRHRYHPCLGGRRFRTARTKKKTFVMHSGIIIFVIER